jgi:hypothetical protein
VQQQRTPVRLPEIRPSSPDLEAHYDFYGSYSISIRLSFVDVCYFRLFACPNRFIQVMHPSLLSWSKALSAPIRGIIHKIVDQIKSRYVRTAVLLYRASVARVGLCLGRGVVNKVTISFTATLESVEQAKPMADFICLTG